MPSAACQTTAAQLYLHMGSVWLERVLQQTLPAPGHPSTFHTDASTANKSTTERGIETEGEKEKERGKLRARKREKDGK